MLTSVLAFPTGEAGSWGFLTFVLQKQEDVQQSGCEVQMLHDYSMPKSEPGLTRQTQPLSQKSPKEWLNTSIRLKEIHVWAAPKRHAL